MRWTVVDSLYCEEAFFCSHLDSYGHYLREAGESMCRFFWTPIGPVIIRGDEYSDESDSRVLFALDQYDRAIEVFDNVKVRIAQVAAVCNPMPWNVRKPDGSPAYDCVISSIPWMVEESRKHGCRGEYMPLAFDTRARVCGMGVKRDLDCIFIGTVGPNHQRRAQLLEELKDVVQVLPPVFGREYFKTIARARVVLNVHAEWSRGVRNNMRIFEVCGMGKACITDGKLPQIHGTYENISLPGRQFSDPDQVRKFIAHRGEILRARNLGKRRTLLEHTYIERIPRLIEIAKELLG